MSNPHFLKTANKIKADNGLTFQIVDLLETSDGGLCVYTKKGAAKQDFRQFKDDLGAALGLRVEVVPLGSRELMAVLGGIGRCDQELCCHRWLPAPQNVGTQTLVEQDLSGIPGDYLGLCGKLLCCLLYEGENFKLECANGEGLRARLRKESAAVQVKVEEVKKQTVAAPPPEEKRRRVVRRFIRR